MAGVFICSFADRYGERIVAVAKKEGVIYLHSPSGFVAEGIAQGTPVEYQPARAKRSVNSPTLMDTPGGRKSNIVHLDHLMKRLLVKDQFLGAVITHDFSEGNRLFAVVGVVVGEIQIGEDSQAIVLVSMRGTLTISMGTHRPSGDILGHPFWAVGLSPEIREGRDIVYACYGSDGKSFGIERTQSFDIVLPGYIVTSALPNYRGLPKRDKVEMCSSFPWMAIRRAGKKYMYWPEAFGGVVTSSREIEGGTNAIVRVASIDDEDVVCNFKRGEEAHEMVGHYYACTLISTRNMNTFIFRRMTREERHVYEKYSDSV
jgi:hypothetical protein